MFIEMIAKTASVIRVIFELYSYKNDTRLPCCIVDFKEFVIIAHCLHAVGVIIIRRNT